MPYTAAQLTTFYTNENLGIAPTASETLLIGAYASQNQAGILSDAQTLANVGVYAQDKTDVALGAYQYFTGATPTLAGLAYLVHGGGNANDLSSSYYAGFNKENRYYNFAINLALDPASAASAAFAASYAGLTFAQAVTVAYEQIVGSAVVGATQAAAAIASITAAQSFFASVAASRATGANQDLAVKAIMIGYILEEAQKADVGIYAKGVDGFILDLQPDGVATTGSLLTNYPATPVGGTFVLTTGVDLITGTSGSDTVTGTDLTYTGLDKIDTGNGADTLTLNDVAGSSIILGLGTVANVETFNLNSALALKSGAADVSGFTGLTTANIALNLVNGVDQAVTAASTTAVNLTATVITGASSLQINGGSIDKVSLVNAVNNSGKTVTITGKGITSASVTQTNTTAGWDAGVVITDLNTTTAATIASAVINGLDGAVATVTSDALTSLSLSNSSKSVTVANTTAKHALGLTLNGDTAGTIADANAGTVNVTTTGTKSTGITVSAAAATAMTIGGTAALSATLTAGNVATLTLSGAGAVTADLTGLAAKAAVTATASTGLNTVVLGATQTFAGGSGGSTVTVGADVTVAVSGGSGAADEIVLGFNAAGLSKTGTNVSNFEVIGVGAGSQGTYDISTLTASNAITGLDVRAGVAAAVVFNNVAAGTALAVSAVPGFDVTYNLKTDTTSDSINLSLGTAATAGLTFAQNIVLPGIETVTVNSLGTVVTATGVSTGTNVATIVDTATKSLVLAGAESLTLTDAGSAVATINATAMAKGSALDVTAVGLSSGGVTFTGGAGATTLTDTNLLAAKVLTYTATDGINTITLSSATTGSLNATLGNGANVINTTGNLGASTITVGNGGNTITVGNGSNTVVAGSGVDTITFGTGLNSVTGGAGADHFKTTTAPLLGNTYTTITDFADKGDTITFGPEAAQTLVKGVNVGLLADTATFQDYLDKASNVAAADHTYNWFNFSGNTYIVDVFNSHGANFTNGADTVIRLTGIVDLSATASSGAADGTLIHS
jgi:S-layer protein